MVLWMISWWASHLGRHPVQQWEVSKIVAWCMLEVCWAFLLAWDVGLGVGCEVLWVQWLEYVMGWPGVGGALLGWQGDGWLVGQIVSWHFGRFVGWRTGRSLVGKEGGD